MMIIGSTDCLAECPSNARTTVVFSNGIGTTLTEAAASLNDVLKPAVIAAAPSTAVDQSCITFAVAYDSTFVDSNNTVISTGNKILQIADAMAQRGVDYAANFWQYWNVSIAPPSWFQDLQRTLITSAASVFQPDLITQELFYSAELGAGHKIVIVTHSQGALYANSAYEVVIGLSGHQQDLHIVSVASPATYVAGNGSHVTLHGDIITLVPGALAANSTNTTPAVCTTDPIGCHNFDKSYMAGDRTNPAIINAIISKIVVSNTSTMNGLALTISPTGVMPSFSIVCSGSDDGTMYISSVDHVVSGEHVLQRKRCNGGTMSFDSFDLNAFETTVNGSYPTWLRYDHVPIYVAVKNTTMNTNGCVPVYQVGGGPYNLICDANGFNHAAYYLDNNVFPTMAAGPQFTFDGTGWSNVGNGDGSVNR